jgi:hypothetical protein
MKNRSAFAVGSDEAASLYFEGRAKPYQTAYAIQAMIVLASGKHVAIYKAILDPTEPHARRPFICRLVEMCPAIDPLYAEERLIEFAASREVQVVEAESTIDFPSVEPELIAAPDNEETVTSSASTVVLTPAEKMLLDPNLMALIVEDVQAMGVAGEENLIVSLYLLAVSRLLEKPLAAIISSASSTGKSITLEQVLKCIPPEAKVVLTSLTDAALFHMCAADPNAIKHKLLALGERKKRHGNAEADDTAARRQLLSERRVSRMITDTSTKPSSKREMVAEGPVALVETTTNSPDKIFAEDRNRCLLLTTDDSPAQNQRVLELLAAKAAGLISVDEDAILNKHYELQRLLKQYEVVIPYAMELRKAFPQEPPEVRRAFENFLSVIRASALLHQRQRNLDPGGRLVASLADYAIARRWCSGPFERQLGRRISVSAINFFGQLLAWPKLQTVDGSMKWNTEFNTTEAWKYVSKSDSIVLKWLKELASIGAVKNIAPSKGQRAKLWRLTGMSLEEVESRGISLPEANELAVRLGLATTQVQVTATM